MNEIFDYCEEGNDKLLCQLIGQKANLDLYNQDNLTPLIVSLISDNYRITELLIGGGCNINLGDIKKRTPLMYASALNPFNTLKILFLNGAGLNEVDDDGKSALIYAISNNQEKNIEFLIENKADPNLADSLGMTPLMYAVLSENAGVVKTLIDSKALVNTVNKQNQSALHFAVILENETIIQLLISAGADLNQLDVDSRTPLILALMSDVDDLFEGLLSDENLNIPDCNGNTALHLATLMGKENTIDQLIKNGADVRLKNKDGQTALSLSSNIEAIRVKGKAENEENAALKSLNGLGRLKNLKNIMKVQGGSASTNPDGISKITGKMDQDNTVTKIRGLKQGDDGKDFMKISGGRRAEETNDRLMIKGSGMGNISSQSIKVTQKQKIDLMGKFDKILVKGKNDDAASGDGSGPFAFPPIEPEKYKSISTLLEKVEKDPLNSLQRKGKSIKSEQKDIPTILAGQEEMPAVISDDEINSPFDSAQDNLSLLLKKLQNTKFTNGKNALMVSAAKGHLAVVTLLIKTININSKDFSGFTALNYAASAGHLPVVEFLIKNGAKIEEKNTKVASPLALAVAKGHYPVAKYLMEIGSNVNARINGNPLLLTALMKNDFEMAKSLVDYNANVLLSNRQGQTPLSYVKDLKLEEMVNYIGKKEKKKK